MDRICSQGRGYYRRLWDGLTLYASTDRQHRKGRGTEYATSKDWKTASSQDDNSINAAPLFISADTNDFRLAADSPCVNAGTDIGLTEDYERSTIPKGGAPDIGAYESGTPTITTPPTVITIVPSVIQSTGAAGGGDITSYGGATVTERGVCWGLTANPTIPGSHTNDGSGMGSYTSSLTGLTPGTIYHARAYATNSSGTGYGNDVTFTTSQEITLPVATTSAMTSITLDGRKGRRNVTSDGGATVTERGVCWGLTANPTISGSHTQDGSGTGSYTSSLTGLTAGHDLSCPGLRDELVGHGLRERRHVYHHRADQSSHRDDLGGEARSPRRAQRPAGT